MLSQPLREINVEALPLEVPEHIDLDVSSMAIGDTLRIGDIAVRARASRFLDDPGDRRRDRHRADARRGEPEEEARRGRGGPRARPPRARPRRGRRGAGEPEATPPATRAPPRASAMRLWPPRASGLVARPARRRARQPGPRVRAQPPQRRLDGRRRARAPARRLVAREVLRPARRDPARRPQARAAEARDVHERVRPLGRRRGALLQARARRGARRPRRGRPRPRAPAGCGSAAGSPATTACARSRST